MNTASTPTTEELYLDSVTAEVRRLDARNQRWRDQFDPEFGAAIMRAMTQYSWIERLEPRTARVAKEKQDAMLYLAMSVYASIEAVIQRKRLRAQEEGAWTSQT